MTMLDHVIFGRNEQGNQHFHQWVDRVLGADSDDELNSLFESVGRTVTSLADGPS